MVMSDLKSCGVAVSNMALLSTALVVLLVGSTGLMVRTHAGDFHEEFDLVWGDQRAKVVGGGKVLTLTLDKISGSGFASKRHYHFTRIDMQIKLVAGNSAGTVTAFYMASEGPNRDEIDFEFLGNVTGEPYIVHTNVYTQGKGEREQQFYLWFDPTKNFHTYSMLWNPQLIMFLVDNIPMRVFHNKERIGVPFPKNQPMKLYSSLWNADQWATRGGLVKTDWSKAPFTAFYRNFRARPAAVSSARAGLDRRTRRWLMWVRKHYLIYNYCVDHKRFFQGRPRECKRLRF